MKKLLLSLIFLSSCATMQTDASYPQSFTTPYYIGGSYYKTCKAASLGISAGDNMVIGSLTAVCDEGSTRITHLNTYGCTTGQNDFVIVENRDSYLHCSHIEPYHPAPAISHNPIAGSYYKSCEPGTVTFTLLAGNVYVPRILTAKCGGVVSTILIYGSCRLSSSGFYEIANHDGQLHCSN